MDEPGENLLPEPIRPGRRLGSNYVVGERLGRGAMGVVHEATTHDGRSLAVKFLRAELAADHKTVARFLQERHIFRRVQHPNVVRVHDLVAEGDDLAIVMERVTGGDLKRRIEARSLSPKQSMAIAAGIAAGLQVIHQAKVVHRDLKPANILLNEDLSPKISDFGISRLVSEAMTRTSATIGTPIYMAPEAADARGADAPADVYALGIIMFEMLVGRPPFAEGGTFAVLRAHAMDPPPKIDGIPAPLAELIDHMLAKEPHDRPTIDFVQKRVTDLLPLIDDKSQPVAVPGPAAGGVAATSGEVTGRPAGGATAVLPPDSSPAGSGQGDRAAAAGLAGAAAAAGIGGPVGAVPPPGPGGPGRPAAGGPGAPPPPEGLQPAAHLHPAPSGDPAISGDPAYRSGDPAYHSGDPAYRSGDPAISGDPAYHSGDPAYRSGGSAETFAHAAAAAGPGVGAEQMLSAPPPFSPPTGGDHGRGGILPNRIPRRVLEGGLALGSVAALLLVVILALNLTGGDDTAGVDSGKRDDHRSIVAHHGRRRVRRRRSGPAGVEHPARRWRRRRLGWIRGHHPDQPGFDVDHRQRPGRHDLDHRCDHHDLDDHVDDPADHHHVDDAPDHHVELDDDLDDPAAGADPDRERPVDRVGQRHLVQLRVLHQRRVRYRLVLRAGDRNRDARRQLLWRQHLLRPPPRRLPRLGRQPAVRGLQHPAQHDLHGVHLRERDQRRGGRIEAIRERDGDHLLPGHHRRQLIAAAGARLQNPGAATG